MSKFKIGDLVCQPPNGPAMSVKETGNIDDDPNKCIVLCTWFEGINIFEHEFNEKQLIPWEKETASPL